MKMENNQKFMKLKRCILYVLLACILLPNTEAFAKEQSECDSSNIVAAKIVKKEKKSKKKVIGYKYKYKTVKEKVKTKEYLGKFTVTYYCSCPLCCDGEYKKTEIGKKPKVGRTVVVDPKVIPLKTKLKIGNKSGYVAEDTNKSIKGNNIDIYTSNHKTALKKGRTTQKVYAIKTKTVKKKKKIKIPVYEK